MNNKESQSFYLAIIGCDLYIDYFSSKDDNSNYQKKYLMPDTLDDNLNLSILTKFILEKVKFHGRLIIEKSFNFMDFSVV